MNFNKFVKEAVIDFNGDMDFGMHVSQVLDRWNLERNPAIQLLGQVAEKLNELDVSKELSIDKEYTLYLSLWYQVKNWCDLKGYTHPMKNHWKH